jgi:hypothetical protein
MERDSEFYHFHHAKKSRKAWSLWGLIPRRAQEQLVVARPVILGAVAQHVRCNPWSSSSTGDFGT